MIALETLRVVGLYACNADRTYNMPLESPDAIPYILLSANDDCDGSSYLIDVFNDKIIVYNLIDVFNDKIIVYNTTQCRSSALGPRQVDAQFTPKQMEFIKFCMTRWQETGETDPIWNPQ